MDADCEPSPGSHFHVLRRNLVWVSAETQGGHLEVHLLCIHNLRLSRTHQDRMWPSMLCCRHAHGLGGTALGPPPAISASQGPRYWTGKTSAQHDPQPPTCYMSLLPFLRTSHSPRSQITPSSFSHFQLKCFTLEKSK